jgi:hypothetical protein
VAVGFRTNSHVVGLVIVGMAALKRGGRGDARRVSNRRAGDTACAVPWTDDARADAKTRLLEFVTGTPDGANLPYIVRTVFGRDTDMAGADGQLARRFFEDLPELFKTTRRAAIRGSIHGGRPFT